MKMTTKPSSSASLFSREDLLKSKPGKSKLLTSALWVSVSLSFVIPMIVIIMVSMSRFILDVGFVVTALAESMTFSVPVAVFVFILGVKH